MKNREEIIETKANHIITSAINLIEMIHQTYGKEEAELFEKKFISSIRGKDPDRFAKTVSKVRGNDDK